MSQVQTRPLSAGVQPSNPKIQTVSRPASASYTKEEKSDGTPISVCIRVRPLSEIENNECGSAWKLKVRESVIVHRNWYTRSVIHAATHVIPLDKQITLPEAVNILIVTYQYVFSPQRDL
jgi:hypothetical protein